MRKLKLGLTASFLAGAAAAACSGGSDNTITGMRSDGVMVECEQESEDVNACTPRDGDNRCESWEDGGAAIVLWPPNHKLLRFTLADCAALQEDCGGGGSGSDGGGDGSGSGSGSGSDDGGVIILRTATAIAADAHITSITADEALEVGAGGDGHTPDYDMGIIDATTFELRSERQGGGDGRVYRVNYVDGAGVTGSCEFLVPHDRGPTNGAVDSGTVVTETP